MKKIKILIFVVVMVMGLSTLSLAFSQGDEVRVRVTGYVGGPNGTLSAAGINCIAGKTAAVSYTGGIGNPDLKYGTIVYLESQNKCYVICDVGSSKAGASLGIEPFCSTVNECYSITGYSTAKILYVPTGGNAYNNVINSLNNLHKYTGDTKVESGAAKTNTCLTCEGEIGTAYYPLGDKHYRACANGHHSYIEEHNYVDGKCKTCGAVKSSKTESGATQTKTCQTCGDVIGTEYYPLGDKHYRTCAKGHHSYIEDHNYVNGRCKTCGAVKSNKTDSSSITINKCNKCIVAGCNGIIGTKYYVLGDKHYRVCTADPMHHYDITAHVWNIANKCTKCDIKREIVESTDNSGATTTNVCPDCGDLIIDKWLDRSGINHYRACVNGHEWYVEAHQWNAENRCTICKLGKQSVTQFEKLDSVTKNFSDLPSEHWAYNEVMEMVNVGIVNGKTDGTLGTNDKMTAEEFLDIINNLETNKGMKVNPEKDGFLANEVKLILGNTTEEIKANYKKPITREKAASILGSFIDMKDVSSTNELNAKDWDNVNSIYRKRINKLARKNVFRGVLNPDGSISINPTDEITKAEAIALISRLYDVL